MVWQHTNVYANGELIATEDNTEAHFYLNDWLGTRRVQTNYLGVSEQKCSSLPYGDAETCAPTPTENLFTGKERDSESGNDYFGARYYGSTMGRFLSPDWSVKVEPVPYAKLDDPQSLNLYAYVQNNPIALVDPDGHFHWCAESGTEICEGGGGDTPTSNQGHPSTQPQNGDPTLPTVFKNAPTDPQTGKATPPPVPVPGAPEGTGWKWNPNSQNPRGGTWGPTGWKGPNPRMGAGTRMGTGT
jgi:RHS repeat-associated protein